MKNKLQKKKATSVREVEPTYITWKHAGGKLRQKGPEHLSDSELLSILIASGIKGKSAEQIAEDIIQRFGSFKGLANQPLEKLEKLRGLGPVKTIRIAAAFEIARRIVHQVKQKV